MTWIIKLDKSTTVESDDFTIDQLDRIEKETGAYWSIMNPLKEIRIAKAFIKMSLEVAGRDPAEADTMTLKQLKTMFDFRADDTDTGEEADTDPTPARKGPTRQESSGTASRGGGGPRKQSELSA